ncbi:citrate lyase holo-[acyl-carrier protein] synthase [Eubacteriales bacterium OttesenSCG-928-K08]|nr:citrate lyase holo-[acyl-carrier protein] synthase [Eubacteriales bacterium OttesenSCG-928-K08]
MIIIAPFEGKIAHLQELLSARELRASRRKALAKHYNACVICVQVNMPGAIKQNLASEEIFQKAQQTLEETLAMGGYAVLFEQAHMLITGPEGFWVVNAPAATIKRDCCKIEQAHKLGRLFDLDVTDAAGHAISRIELGLEPRRCIVCGGPAADCVSRRLHTLADVQAAILSILEEI